jgi:hypothetical protein
MNAEDESNHLPALIEYTEMLDKIRGTDFSKTFPELSPYWEEHMKRKPPKRTSTTSQSEGSETAVKSKLGLKRLWKHFTRKS